MHFTSDGWYRMMLFTYPDAAQIQAMNWLLDFHYWTIKYNHTKIIQRNFRTTAPLRKIFFISVYFRMSKEKFEK